MGKEGVIEQASSTQMSQAEIEAIHAKRLAAELILTKEFGIPLEIVTNIKLSILELAIVEHQKGHDDLIEMIKKDGVLVNVIRLRA